MIDDNRCWGCKNCYSVWYVLFLRMTYCLTDLYPMVVFSGVASKYERNRIMFCESINKDAFSDQPPFCWQRGSQKRQ